MTEKAIPMLPCQSLQPVLDFYTALGFEVALQQKSPNPYAVVAYGAIELHFFGMKGYDPTQSYSGCCVATDDVDTLHAAFRTGLKATYGKIPSRGLPRIGPIKDMSYGARQFLMSDPGGNCVRVAQKISEYQHHRPAPKEPFARALHYAAIFTHSREDPAGAAQIIDRVLGLEDERPTPLQEARLLLLRAEAAHQLGDDATAEHMLDTAAAVQLTEEQRDAVRGDLKRLTELLASGQP